MNEVDTLRAEKRALETKYGQAVWALMQIALLHERVGVMAARNIANQALPRILPKEVREALAEQVNEYGWLAEIPFLETNNAAQE